MVLNLLNKLTRLKRKHTNCYTSIDSDKSSGDNEIDLASSSSSSASGGGSSCSSTKSIQNDRQKGKKITKSELTRPSSENESSLSSSRTRPSYSSSSFLPSTKSFLFLFVVFLIFSNKMCHAYFKCTKDGFFPDKTDCWVYHICDGGTHTVRACDEDLFFNPKTGLCDWPMNVECKQAQNAVNKKPSSALSSGPASDHSAGNKTSHKLPAPFKTNHTTISSVLNNQLALTNAEETPADSDTESLIESMCSKDDYGYIAYPKDCRRYIYCQEGQAKVFACQGGLLWKQSDGNCVWPLDSDCPTLKRPTTSTSQYSNNHLMNAHLNSAQYLAILRENYGSIECPMDLIGFFPNPYDCSAYHFCNGGKDQVILCEPGLHYRQDKQVCDWPQNSNCHSKCMPNTHLIGEKKERSRFLDTKSCCRYFECINGQLVTQVCQYPLQFDVQTKQCVDYTRVKCGIRKECTNPCNYFTNEDVSLCDMVPSCNGKPSGVYLDQNRPNCQFFYTCRDHRVFNHTRCQGNYRFNQYEGRCMPAQYVKCASSSSLLRPADIIVHILLTTFLFLILI